MKMFKINAEMLLERFDFYSITKIICFSVFQRLFLLHSISSRIPTKSNSPWTSTKMSLEIIKTKIKMATPHEYYCYCFSIFSFAKSAKYLHILARSFLAFKNNNAQNIWIANIFVFIFTSMYCQYYMRFLRSSHI